MKLIAYILVVIGLSISAQAYDDYQYQKLADCVDTQNLNLHIVVETAPANTATITIDSGNERMVHQATHKGEESAAFRTIEFTSSEKIADEPLVSGYVEYCGTFCAQDSGMLYYTRGFDHENHKIAIPLNCKKLF